jgi:hypothetical protein
MAESSKKTRWAQNFMAKIEGKVDQDGNTLTEAVPILFSDNKAAVLLTQGLTSISKIHHIDNAYFMIKDNIREGTIKIHWIPGKDQLVDGFTKPLAQPAFEESRKRIRVKNVRKVME